MDRKEKVLAAAVISVFVFVLLLIFLQGEGDRRVSIRHESKTFWLKGSPEVAFSEIKEFGSFNNWSDGSEKLLAVRTILKENETNYLFFYSKINEKAIFYYSTGEDEGGYETWNETEINYAEARNISTENFEKFQKGVSYVQDNLRCIEGVAVLYLEEKFTGACLNRSVDNVEVRIDEL